MSGFATGLATASSSALDAIDAATSRQQGDGGSKFAGAARDFEALLLSQILKSAHEEGGWLGAGNDEAGDVAVGLGEEQLAHSIAASGGLGLSRLIESGLRNPASEGKGVPSRNKGDAPVSM